MPIEKSSVITVSGGKITFEDFTSKALENYLRIFDFLAKGIKTKTVSLFLEAPDVVRGLLDAVPKEQLERKYKISIVEGKTEVPLKTAKEIIDLAKGFDIVVKFDIVEMIFFHTGRLEILVEMQFAPKISALLQKMFPKAKMK